MEVDIIGLAAVLLLFGLIPVTVGTVLYKIRARRLETLVKLVENGATIDAETIRLMGGHTATYRTDYMWGMLWLAVGLPVLIGVWVQVGIGFAVWGLIPVFIGLAFLAAGKLRLRETTDGSDREIATGARR